MKYTGKHLKTCVGSEVGALFLSVSFTLIAILLCLVALTYTFEAVILANNLTGAFYSAGANTITSIRRDFYSPLTETNTTSISESLQAAHGSAYINSMNRNITENLVSSLNCTDSGLGKLVKYGPNSTVAYTITNISCKYFENVCTVTATLKIPIRFNGNHITDYIKNLEASYALSFK